MMIEIETIEGGQKDFSSLEGTTLKKPKHNIVLLLNLQLHTTVCLICTADILMHDPLSEYWVQSLFPN